MAVPDLEWQERGACRAAQLELFYSGDEEDIRQALGLCRGCEVRPACLAYAMEHREPFGVWGGTTERQRRRVFRRAAERRRQDPTAA